VGKDYIDFCGHSCPPSSLLDIEQDPEQLLRNEKQQQSVFSEEPISRIQEYRKRQSDEIVMLSAPVSLLPDYETSEWKNEQQQSSIKMHLPNLNGEVSSDLPREVQVATGNHEETETMNHIRTYEEEYFHNLQPQLGQTIGKTRKPILPNNKKEQAHQLITSQDYHVHEDHDDHYQQYSQQDEFMNERGKDEFDGIDYGYDYDSQERTAVATYEEQSSAPEITDKQYSHQNYPYDSRTETFSSTLVPHVNFNQQPNLVQSVHKRHNLTDPPLQEHLGVPSENFYRQQQFPEFLPENFNHKQQIYSQPSGSEPDEYYRRQQQESTISPEEYHRGQQAHPQPSGSELDEYYRRQQQESTTSPEEYHREQQARPEPSGSEVDEYYRSQQQYNGKGHQDSLEAKHYPNSSADLVHEQQLSSYVQGWNVWTTWSICPVTCGDSVQTRHRTCSSPTGINCLGEITQQRPCHFRPCDMWTDWNDNCGSCTNH
ncbi:thrombospondin type 1 domain-containing protein, partial [Wuchereria bancrofti]